jgi:predicted HAD superfamily Cof-like phosphohydrolase
MDWIQARVREWHRKYGVLVNETPTVADSKTRNLRVELIREEWEEFREACLNQDSQPATG